MSTSRFEGSSPAAWLRVDNALLPLWWQRLCEQSNPVSASSFAAGLFAEDRRRPIAQWHNPALDAALLVAPETAPEWPLQRFGIFYAPPGQGVLRVHSAVHGWQPRNPSEPGDQELAFREAIIEAERFLQLEMDFV
ncbi:hypothetical protein [Psychromicrobium lacuslunae]|uniref:Uncharacterized protein n=1 Tax=Psychromicrobium lacuslunae TaxID=1618207 RepID=A0A0D4BWL1_9MICC|nr:hypothetical protein [Psychromicrobium lacuslunae]AJT40495.1 hypothetical protein UM93_01160 [Psychromicrobium lacuslunae]